MEIEQPVLVGASAPRGGGPDRRERTDSAVDAQFEGRNPTATPATKHLVCPIPRPSTSPATVDFKSLPRSAPAREVDLRRFFQSRLPRRGLLRRPPVRTCCVCLVTATPPQLNRCCQEPKTSSASATSAAGRPVARLPDQMTSMVKITRKASSAPAVEACTIDAATPGRCSRLRQRGHARVQRKLLKKNISAAHGGLRLLDTLVAEGDDRPVQGADRPRQQPPPARRANHRGPGRVQVGRRGFDHAPAYPRLDRRGPAAGRRPIEACTQPPHQPSSATCTTSPSSRSNQFAETRPPTRSRISTRPGSRWQRSTSSSSCQVFRSRLASFSVFLVAEEGQELVTRFHEDRV